MEKIALITLDRGRSNAIDAEMVMELKDIIQNIGNDDNISGVILTGKDEYFTAGLDLLDLFDYSEDQIKTFWEQYFGLIYALTSFKKPLISAINGHAPAAGTIFCLCSDYRIMVQGNYSIGLNEIALGIIVPDSFFQLYASCIGRQKAGKYLLEAKLVNPEEALSIGLIDEMVSSEILMNTAVRQMQKYLQFNKVVWQESKFNIRRNLAFAVQPHQPDIIKKILDEWWAPYNRSILQTIIKNFKKS
ncbi:enoyl-CoA hydratase/isomerase family protein [Pedobacter sp. P351]|uniref:enoyl-CoA hydratase/isomerase family protein n=1 Tax=Pedobacter superstes TaxID=3133441 RepID=UPI0030B6449E